MPTAATATATARAVWALTRIQESVERCTFRTAPASTERTSATCTLLARRAGTAPHTNATTKPSAAANAPDATSSSSRVQ